MTNLIFSCARWFLRPRHFIFFGSLVLLLAAAGCQPAVKPSPPGAAPGLTFAKPADWPLPKSPYRILVVPLAFSKKKADGAEIPMADQNLLSLDEIRQRYAKDMVEYFRQLSNGRIEVEVAVTEWVMLPKPVDEYRMNFRIYHADRMKTWLNQVALVRDGANAIDGTWDVSAYDALMMVPGCSAMEFGGSGYVFRHAKGFPVLWTRSGKRIPPTDVHAQTTPFPSLPHSLAHIMGGYRDGRVVVPDLFSFEARSTPGPYSYANQYVGGDRAMQYYAGYAGPWDVMSQHGIKIDPRASFFQGIAVQGMTSFTRMRLGLVPRERVLTVQPGETKKVRLGPLIRADAGISVIHLPLDASRYYLIENRQQEGLDKHLPSEGVLILKVDERVADGQGPVRVVDAHPQARFFSRAPFQAGEAHQNPEENISVKVLGKEGADYWVEVGRGM